VTREVEQHVGGRVRSLEESQPGIRSSFSARRGLVTKDSDIAVVGDLVERQHVR
jgi:hypothetical protein